MLDGKIALVTGAARGIGAAASRALAREGAHVVVTARKADDAEALARTIAQEGGKATAAVLDVSDHAGAAAALSALHETVGEPDILVSNAGMIEPIATIQEADPEQWARAIDVNLIGAFTVIHALLPAMVEKGEGRILNLSSGAAHRPLKAWSAYCASKAGLAMLTRSISLEYADKGIVAIGFAPGLVDTDMQGTIRESGANEVSAVPRETLADPERVGQAIAWLCTEAGKAYAGTEVDFRDAEFQSRAGV